MKLYLEEETGIGETLKISKIKEVNSKADAIKDKTGNKCYLHTCYHDDPKNGQCRPCKREDI
jgi:hypothetical protein